MKTKNKPLASVSLDLDNLWSYLKTHGDKKWENYPSYFDIFIPYIINILNELNLKITFFIVGRDAILKGNKIYLQQLVKEGHDIANHSFDHEVWINKYEKERLIKEFENSEKAIYDATGKMTVGFRGPGFSWNEDILELLLQRGYQYDASTLPTFIGPLARVYFVRKASFSKEDKKKRENLFGSFKEGFRKVKPYLYKLKSGKNILEIPVTTMPIFRLPFHMSYLIYLNNYSNILMKIYLCTAIYLCKLTKTPISFLLHPLDIIGGDRINELSFFPGMNVRSERKIEIFKEVITILKKHFTLVDMQKHARELREKQKT